MVYKRAGGGGGVSDGVADRPEGVGGGREEGVRPVGFVRSGDERGGLAATPGPAPNGRGVKRGGGLGWRGREVLLPARPRHASATVNAREQALRCSNGTQRETRLVAMLARAGTKQKWVRHQGEVGPPTPAGGRGKGGQHRMKAASPRKDKSLVPLGIAAGHHIYAAGGVPVERWGVHQAIFMTTLFVRFCGTPAV